MSAGKRNTTIRIFLAQMLLVFGTILPAGHSISQTPSDAEAQPAAPQITEASTAAGSAIPPTPPPSEAAASTTPATATATAPVPATTPATPTPAPQVPTQSQPIQPASSVVTPVAPVQPLIPVTGPTMTPHAVVKTTMGTFVIRLFHLKAPRTVKNFIALATGEKEFIDAKTSRKVNRPFYDGLTFHKVVPGFVIQTGCPFGTGTGGPGYTTADEIDTSLRHFQPGVVSMANVGKDTNGSQFFITLGRFPELDGKYTIFGEIVSGMKVVTKISRVKRGPTDMPVSPVIIESVTIEER